MKKIIFFLFSLIVLSSCSYHREVVSTLGSDNKELVLRDQNNMPIESSKWKSNLYSKYEHKTKFEKGISKSIGFKAENNILLHNPYCQKLIVSNQTVPEFFSPTVQLDPKSDLEKHKVNKKTTDETLTTILKVLQIVSAILCIILTIAFVLVFSRN